MAEQNAVFIVYGRNHAAHAALTQFLRALGVRPLDFEHIRAQLTGTPFVGNIVQEGMRRAQAIIVLLTPDERAALQRGLRDKLDVSSERWQPRPNVLLEAGIAFGINEQRTILVTLGPVELPSDLLGRHSVTLNNSVQARERLRSALVASGCELPGPDPRWHNPEFAGDFENGLASVPPVSSPFRPRLAAALVVLGLALAGAAGFGTGWMAGGAGPKGGGINVTQARQWLEQANQLCTQGRYGDAIVLYDRIIEAQPGADIALLAAKKSRGAQHDLDLETKVLGQ